MREGAELLTSEIRGHAVNDRAHTRAPHPRLALAEPDPEPGVNTDDLLWYIPGLGTRELWSWGKGAPNTSHFVPRSCIPTQEDTETITQGSC